MNAEKLLVAMGGIRPVFVVEAQRFLGLEPERRRSGRKLRAAVLIAAALALLLAACGYAVYRASMQHRVPRPDDEMRYFINGSYAAESGDGPRLNFGECALVMHFGVEPQSAVHAIRLADKSFLPGDWELGPINATLADFLYTFTPEYAEVLGGRPGGGLLDESALRPMEQALAEAGVTQTEAEAWYRNLAWYREGELVLRIDFFDGTQLNGVDLICGWPKGSATIVSEEKRGEYQLLEAIVETEAWGGAERVAYLFLFQPEQQYLIAMTARADEPGFAAMERIADGLEIRETGLRYTRISDGMNFSVLSFANG